jgi:hypothetical protein
MTAIDYNPFDGDGVSINPHRPSLDQLGGNQKQGVDNYPASSDEPHQDEWNRFAELIQLASSIIPCLKLTIGFVGGVPQIDNFWCSNSSVVIGDIILTDNADGDTDIEWPANKLPTLQFDPDATLNEETNATTIMAILDEPNRTVRVYTPDESAGVGVDTRFTVTLT